MILSLTPKAWTNSQTAQSPPCVVHGKSHYRSMLLLLDQGLVTSGGHLWVLGQCIYCAGVLNGWAAPMSPQSPASLCSHDRGPHFLNGSSLNRGQLFGSHRQLLTTLSGHFRSGNSMTEAAGRWNRADLGSRAASPRPPPPHSVCVMLSK